jgi:hypothetical protein
MKMIVLVDVAAGVDRIGIGICMVSLLVGGDNFDDDVVVINMSGDDDKILLVLAFVIVSVTFAVVNVSIGAIVADDGNDEIGNAFVVLEDKANVVGCVVTVDDDVVDNGGAVQ